MSQLLRIKCPSCGNVVDVPGTGSPCAKCSTPLVLPEDGVLQLYRMGNPLGMAVGFGVYLNDIPMGHLANAESIRIPVGYGHYKVTFSQGMSRKCQAAEVDVTPQNRFAYVKVHIKPGFFTNTLVAEQTTADQMPPL